MRIIGGKYGGRVLRPPAGLPVRPTTDRAKEALFNILGLRFGIEGGEVLDLFAGTGNVSFEFASRGAASVTSVDQSHKAVVFINDTYKLLGYQGGHALKSDAFSYLRKCTGRFDFIFADPPYALPSLSELPGLVLARQLLKEDGIFILEHARQTTLPPEGLFDRREYGQSVFSFYRGKK